jgi:DNA polymerase-1
MQQDGPAARLIMQVHDELVFEVREDELDRLRDAVIERMAGAAELDVPLVVDCGHGPNWDTAH